MGPSICKAMQKAWLQGQSIWLQGQSNTFMDEVANTIFANLPGITHVRLARAFTGNNLGNEVRAGPGAQA